MVDDASKSCSDVISATNDFVLLQENHDGNEVSRVSI